MSTSFPIGEWSWNERWMYPQTQLYDLPFQTNQHQHQKFNPTIEEKQNNQILSGSQTSRVHSTSSNTFKPHPPSSSRSSYPPPSLSSSNSYCHSNGSQTSRISSTNNNDNFVPSLPSIPTRFRDGTYLRYSSEYSDLYREPDYVEKSVFGNSILSKTGYVTARVPQPPSSDSSLSSPSSSSNHSFNPHDFDSSNPSLISSSSSSSSSSLSSSSSSPSSPSPPKDLKDTAGVRLPIRDRRPKAAPIDFEHHHLTPFWNEHPSIKQQLRPEQHCFRLWGRINSAHCILPYQTTQQLSYRNHQTNNHNNGSDTIATPATSSSSSPYSSRPLHKYGLKIHEKDYNNAMIKAQNTGILRGMPPLTERARQQQA